jgi:hypothetical protein
MSHRALSPQQFNLAQVAGLHPSLGGEKVPDVISGGVARHVMERADIRQTKRGVDAPHIVGVTQGYGEERGYPHGEVMTSQRHLHIPTIKRYIHGDIPKLDPDYDIDESEGPNVPYEPETYHYGGKEWVAEGHHRIVAQRLR